MEEFINGLLEEPLTLVDVVQHGLFECTVAIRIDDTGRDWSYNLEDIYTAASLEKGIPTGIQQVDEKTGGLQPGTFNTLAGFAGAGKTTAAVNIAYNALKEEKNVCYITFKKNERQTNL